jgi:hypothetical protein
VPGCFGVSTGFLPACCSDGTTTAAEGTASDTAAGDDADAGDLEGELD